MTQPISPSSSGAPSSFQPLIQTVAVLALLFVFLMGVNGLGDGFKSLGSGLLDSFFQATSNPFVSLMVGILATTLVQSSSVSTSLIVGLVAAPENPLPIANAVPMIMGANIGTTVTNTIVSLAHMGRPEEFRRAFSVATCHDFFNYMTVVVLLPMELMTGYLRRTAESITFLVTGFQGAEYDSPIKGAIKGAVEPIKSGIGFIASSESTQATILIGVSAVLIFGALYSLVRVMRTAMRVRVERLVSKSLGKQTLVAMMAGMIITVMVQSSSITTSLLVPLAGAGVLTLGQAFPVTIGANIGTTVTAFLAALAATGENAEAAVTIALVHLLFNVSGTVLIYPVRRIRNLPLIAAQRLADLAVKSRPLALLYVVALFYLLPAVFAFINAGG